MKIRYITRSNLFQVNMEKNNDYLQLLKYSSINKIIVRDCDKDGNLNALIAGNLFWSEVETTLNDAGHGLSYRKRNREF